MVINYEGWLDKNVVWVLGEAFLWVFFIIRLRRSVIRIVSEFLTL